ncbi:hypothetical protein WDU94_009132 [Cyamophila willieti]
MAKLIGLDKLANYFRVIKHNGGILGSIKTLLRTDDLKFGTLVGVDKLGNKYFENNLYFYGRNRWVVYHEKFGLNYDGSLVPSEWYGWLHYKTDYLPHEDPGRPKHKWMIQDWSENLSGSDKQYVPYGTTRTKVEGWTPPK